MGDPMAIDCQLPIADLEIGMFATKALRHEVDDTLCAFVSLWRNFSLKARPVLHSPVNWILAIADLENRMFATKARS